jgi:hypothetical protein
MQVNFIGRESLSLENSFGTIKAEENILLDVSITITGSEDRSEGSFEIYDVETGGEDWYAEGCLSFDGKELIDYDGVFALPRCVIDKLTELGYDASYAE